MSDRLKKLRDEMAKQNIDGFFIPRADRFQGEYVPASAERLSYLTGFTGSAGCAIVLQDKAAFFTDGRYTLQAQSQINHDDFDIYSTSENQGTTPTLKPNEWLSKNLPAHAVFGMDAWLHTAKEIDDLKTILEKSNSTLNIAIDNPLDLSWHDRPSAPKTPVAIHPLIFSGIPSARKRENLAQKMRAADCDTLVISLPENICWLLNVRGNDVPCTPLTLSYALAHQDGTMDWFIDEEKLSDDVRTWVGADITIHDLESIENVLSTLAKDQKTIWIDPTTTPVKLSQFAQNNNKNVYFKTNPLALMQAQKNDTEIQGAIHAHIRDGIAVTRFLAKISEQGAGARYDELSATALLEGFRMEEKHYKDRSFDTISGAGANGAIIHYRSTPETNQPLIAGPVYLVDSGGQYLDGTTDITRTIAVDTPSDIMRENYTRVLKGHIQVAMSTFPEGTTGDALDTKARASLKQVGRDFAHGTGHGVGSYLSVHEGPCSISPRATAVPLMVGMILSNEPGYYEAGSYGIRLENLITVVDTGKVSSAGKKIFGFKTLTLAPFDRHMIEVNMLSTDEKQWLNDYHARVIHTLIPLLVGRDEKAIAFLREATRTL